MEYWMKSVAIEIEVLNRILNEKCTDLKAILDDGSIGDFSQTNEWGGKGKIGRKKHPNLMTYQIKCTFLNKK